MPLMRRTEIGSAHTGLGEWLLQRLSALYISGFVVFLVVRFSLIPIREYTDWKTWVSSGVVRIGLALFIASVLVHVWIGIRSVLMDYVRILWFRFFLLLFMAVGLITQALWSAYILLVLIP